MAYPTNLKSRLAKLESELMGPSDATLEELVLASMRPDLCDAETARRIETSRLARLVVASVATPARAAAPQQAFSLAHAVEEAFGGAPIPIPAAPQPSPKPPSLLAQVANELGVDVSEVTRALRGLESRPSPTSAPAAEEQRSPPPPVPAPVPQPVTEIGRSHFSQRGEVIGSGYSDAEEFVRPEPGMPLSALMAQHRASRKDW
jgi:hypothetical protein